MATADSLQSCVEEFGVGPLRAVAGILPRRLGL